MKEEGVVWLNNTNPTPSSASRHGPISTPLVSETFPITLLPHRTWQPQQPRKCTLPGFNSKEAEPFQIHIDLEKNPKPMITGIPEFRGRKGLLKYEKPNKEVGLDYF